jgi:hypothetical protein
MRSVCYLSLNFNQNWNLSIEFIVTQYQVSQKTVQSFSNCCIRTAGQTGMAKLIRVFFSTTSREAAKKSKKYANFKLY